MTPKELSRQLRTGSGGDLQRRRGVAALSLTACAAMGVIALYQMGLIPTLPNPPIPHFNSDKVDASPEAYSRLDTPDATLGLASYATTLVLAAMGGADRARHKPWIPLALAAKVGFDTYYAARLTISQWTKQHRTFCWYCLTASACTFATVPLVIPETVQALRAVLGRVTQDAQQDAQSAAA